jgi:hypothetical protein
MGKDKPRARVIDLDKENPLLSDIFKAAEKWESLPVEDLSDEQIAILNLKRVAEGANLTEFCFSCQAVCG